MPEICRNRQISGMPQNNQQSGKNAYNVITGDVVFGIVHHISFEIKRAVNVKFCQEQRF